jgi:hypothetical protein
MTHPSDMHDDSESTAPLKPEALPEMIRGWTAPFHVTMDGIKDANGCWICSATNNRLAGQLVELMNFAASAASPAPQRQGVKVKALEWRASPYRENSWLAPHGFGENYVAYRYEGQWRCMGQDWAGIEAAKAAAQQDFEKRILSALETGE